MSISGNRIKERRIEKRLTQEQLADKVNKSKQVISNWERGYSKPIDEDLASLSKVLDVSADYLLGIDELEKPTNKTDAEKEADAKRKKGLDYIKQIKDEKTLDLAIELLEKLAKE